VAEPLGYVIKPFTERELRAVLEMALSKAGASSACATAKPATGSCWPTCASVC
jgi:DNA-binding response OmpR family regulator